jgi:hypothetical protein
VVLLDEMEIDPNSIRLPSWGRVVRTTRAVVPFEVADPDGHPAEPIQKFLREFVARGRRAGSIRSYAYALLR